MPSMISKRVSGKSCDSDHFNKTAPNYNCLSECLVYSAVVNTSAAKNCFGNCEKSFKEKYNNHTSSFKNKSRQKCTELSNCIWELKENCKNHTIDWLSAMKAHP